MSASLPVRVDAERMVAGRRSFEGVLPVAALPRLVEALADACGEVAYRLDFGRSETGSLRLHVRLVAGLMLECQRTLTAFEWPARVDVRLGLLAEESGIPALPEGCEPLLLEDGSLSPRRVIEDELLLALPLVPVKPGSEVPGDAPPQRGAGTPGGDRPVTHPFAGLRELLEARENHR